MTRRGSGYVRQSWLQADGVKWTRYGVSEVR